MKYQSLQLKRYLKKEKISNKHIAKMLSLTEASVSRKMKTGQFFRDEIACILMHCKDKKEGLNAFFPEIQISKFLSKISDEERVLEILMSIPEDISEQEKEGKVDE